MLLFVALLACGSRLGDPLLRALAVMEIGRGRPAGFSLVYFEEQPREICLHLVLDAAGTLTVTTRDPRPGCLEPWQASCWNQETRSRELPAADLRTLRELLLGAGLEPVAAHEATPPGGGHLRLHVAVEGVGEWETRTTVHRATSVSPWKHLREFLWNAARW